MEALPLPTKIEFVPYTDDPNRAKVIIEPCYPGYGTTLGNALRRVLLSSLPGAAVTSVKMRDVQHEFSTLPNVQEDIVDILLNIKQLRVKLFEGEGGTIMLKAHGEKVVKGKDMQAPSNVEIMNPDLVIATLTDKSAELEMELHVEAGRGYVPVEAQQREKADLGVVAIDAIYTPVRNVNFSTENVRVGQMTNYDRLTVEIVTDGSLTPAQAFAQASDILVQHFSLFQNADLQSEKPAKKVKKTKHEETDAETGEDMPSATANEETRLASE